jgi:hypothetical protein
MVLLVRGGSKEPVNMAEGVDILTKEMHPRASSSFLPGEHGVDNFL